MKILAIILVTTVHLLALGKQRANIDDNLVNFFSYVVETHNISNRCDIKDQLTTI